MAKTHVTLQRVHLDSQGYTQLGAYYGTGAPLYWASCFDGGLAVDTIFRASDRKAAIAHTRQFIRAKGANPDEFKFAN